MLLKQEEEGLWPSGGEGAGALEAVPAAGPAGAMGAAAPAAAPAPAPDATRYHLRSGTVGTGGASGDQQTCSYDHQHAVSSLVFTDKCLGFGKCGSVLMGRCALTDFSTQHHAGSLSTPRGLHRNCQFKCLPFFCFGISRASRSPWLLSGRYRCPVGTYIAF